MLCCNIAFSSITTIAHILLCEDPNSISELINKESHKFLEAAIDEDAMYNFPALFVQTSGNSVSLLKSLFLK